MMEYLAKIEKEHLNELPPGSSNSSISEQLAELRRVVKDRVNGEEEKKIEKQIEKPIAKPKEAPKTEKRRPTKKQEPLL